MLAPQRYKIQFTVGEETHEKLQRAMALMRHRLPNGDLAQLFDRELTLLPGAQLLRGRAVLRSGIVVRPRVSGRGICLFAELGPDRVASSSRGRGEAAPVQIDRRNGPAAPPGAPIHSVVGSAPDSRVTIELAEEPMTTLPEYARVPMVFTVDQVLDVRPRDDGPGGFAVSARPLEVPYEKNYDAIAGEGPLAWPHHFDLSNWALFTARVATRIVGGAAVAFDTPGLTMLEGRRDLAVLWDIRVSPFAQGRGVGRALFEKVETWALLRGCRQLKIETQNTNVRACRFYERQGCQLRAIHRGVYPDFPEEIQLLWYKDLPG